MADLIEHAVMIETGKTLDPQHMTVSLRIDLDVLRTVKAGNRAEAVEQMVQDLRPELSYMKQRLSQMGFSPLIRVNARITI